MLGDKIEWPWGKAVCQSKLELPRAPLADAIVMPQQKVRCTLVRLVNGFITKKCAELKAELSTGKAN